MHSSSDHEAQSSIDREKDGRRAAVLRDYHDQAFADRNYGQIRGLFESPAKKVLRHEGIAFVGELIGTFSFLFMAFMIAQIALTENANMKSDPETINHAKLVMVAFGFGFSLMVNVFIWFRVTGGQFNPIVSMGLAIMGAITPARAVVVTIAQILGGIIAAALTDVLTPGPLLVFNALATTENSKVNAIQGLLIELIGTAQLLLTIFFMAGEKHRATPLAPLAIGLSLLLIHLMAVNYTGAGLNPARTLGPAIISGQFKNIGIYLGGQLLGGVIATSIYAFIKWAGYQDVNAGQDSIKAAEVEYVLPLDKGRDISGPTRI